LYCGQGRLNSLHNGFAVNNGFLSSNLKTESLIDPSGKSSLASRDLFSEKRLRLRAPAKKSLFFPLFHNTLENLLVTSTVKFAENKIAAFLVSLFFRVFQTLKLTAKTCFAIDFIFPQGHLPSSNFPTKQSMA